MSPSRLPWGRPKKRNRTLVGRFGRRLLAAQDYRCAGCSARFAPAPASLADPERASIDHVTPKSRGGLSQMDNYLLKHRRCNEGKGDLPPTGCDRLWLAVVAARIQDQKTPGRERAHP